MKLLKRYGQSTGEYAILFAIVLGAVFAMQNYIRNRVARGLGAGADNYATTVGAATGGALGSMSITRTSDSISGSESNMTNAKAGQLKADSNSRQDVTNPE